MGRLVLFVPGFPAWLFEESGGQLDAARWPALSLILARATGHPIEGVSIEQNLITLCGAPSDRAVSFPIAALTALIDNDTHAVEGIMRADPVHLRADPAKILLFNSPDILPSAAEADSLLEEINTGVPGLGISRGTYPGRWYFRSGHAATVVTSSPNAANGRSISDHLPRGEGAAALMRLTNDAQMLLHGAAVNAEREARGIPPINSIWPWGNGSVEDVQIAPPDIVVGDDVLAAGFARRFGLRWCAELEPRDVIEKVSGGRNALVVAGSPTGTVGIKGPLGSVGELEQLWCPVLLRALRRFRVKEVQLITDKNRYSLTPWNLLKIWRGARPRTGGGI